jgi:hypothetical protein
MPRYDLCVGSGAAAEELGQSLGGLMSEDGEGSAVGWARRFRPAGCRFRAAAGGPQNSTANCATKLLPLSPVPPWFSL